MTGFQQPIDYSLNGVLAGISAKRGAKAARLFVKGPKLARGGDNPPLNFDLGDRYFVYPALINIHDHLRGDYLPRVGPPKGQYYMNWAPWDKDLKASPVYSERANIGIEDAYFLGAYKNLFSGVVTVHDHFPHEFNEPFISRLPVRVVREYALAHECSSYDLKWGDGIEIEHDRALKRNQPFITHLEEGYDEEAQAGIEILENLKCLDDHDVFIHCIGFTETDIRKAKKARSHVVWCPASNLFMFNLTCKIRKILSAGINVCIGTDSTHTGSVNILEEMRFARSVYRKMYGEDLPASKIFEMVTINPAKAFRLQDEIGSLEPGKLADLLVARKKHDDPFESLLLTEMSDIALLTRDGNPIFGGEEFADLFAERGGAFTTVTVKKKTMYVAGNPGDLLKRVQELVGFKKILDFMPFSV